MLLQVITWIATAEMELNLTTNTQGFIITQLVAELQCREHSNAIFPAIPKNLIPRLSRIDVRLGIKVFDKRTSPNL